LNHWYVLLTDAHCAVGMMCTVLTTAAGVSIPISTALLSGHVSRVHSAVTLNTRVTIFLGTGTAVGEQVTWTPATGGDTIV